MVRSFKRIWAVALLTGTEGLRQPAFFFLFVAAALLTALSPSFAFFHLGEEVKMVTDLGLSTVLTFSTLLALLTASSTVANEIEGRTALTMLSKPLRREEFLLGKFLGVAVTAAALILLMCPVLLIAMRSQSYLPQQDPWFALAAMGGMVVLVIVFGLLFVSRVIRGKGLTLVVSFRIAYALATAFVFLFLWRMSPPGAVWDWRALVGMFFICLHAWVISAMAVALATRFTLVQSAVGTAVFFMIGHASGGLLAVFRSETNELSAAGRILRAILPDLDQFNITDAIAVAFIDKRVPIPLDVVLSSTVYALLYGAALLAIAAALFARRELS